MSLATRYTQKQAKVRARRRRTAQERLAHDRRQAQKAAEALQQALADLRLPEDLVTELEGRLRSQHKLLGKIVGVMCPPLFGCRTNSELCRVRGWDKNLPSRLLGALPKRSWIKRLRRLGLVVLIPLWRHAAGASEATRSRWQWTWVGDDSVFKKYGEQLGLVGTWWSGQEHRVLSGIDGVLLVVVVGEGKLVVPVDFAIRRPDPPGPGAPCRDKLHWVQDMLDGRMAAFRRRGVELPPPMVVADSWFSPKFLPLKKRILLRRLRFRRNCISVYWEHQPQELERLLLERCGLCELTERQPLQARRHATAVTTTGPEGSQEGMEAVDGQAIGGQTAGLFRVCGG